MFTNIVVWLVTITLSRQYVYTWTLYRNYGNIYLFKSWCYGYFKLFSTLTSSLTNEFMTLRLQKFRNYLLMFYTIIQRIWIRSRKQLLSRLYDMTHRTIHIIILKVPKTDAKSCNIQIGFDTILKMLWWEGEKRNTLVWTVAQQTQT